MRNKEEFYLLVKDLRKIASDPVKLACSCPKTKCEWHGRCRECVAIHRHFGDHLPNCFQAIFNERLKAVASMGEMEAVEKPKTPGEYWDYVRMRDAGAPPG